MIKAKFTLTLREPLSLHLPSQPWIGSFLKWDCMQPCMWSVCLSIEWHKWLACLLTLLLVSLLLNELSAHPSDCQLYFPLCFWYRCCPSCLESSSLSKHWCCLYLYCHYYYWVLVNVESAAAAGFADKLSSRHRDIRQLWQILWLELKVKWENNIIIGSLIKCSRLT